MWAHIHVKDLLRVNYLVGDRWVMYGLFVIRLLIIHVFTVSVKNKCTCADTCRNRCTYTYTNIPLHTHTH